MPRVIAEDTAQRRTILWALGLSVLIHVLLVLLSVWAPLRSGAATVVAVPADEAITFHFAPVAEATTDDPLEDAPFAPVEPTPAAEPPVPPPTAVPMPPRPEPPARDEPLLDEPSPAPEVTEERPEQPEPPVDPAGSDFPEDDRDPLRRTPQPTPPTESPVDLDRALRDFAEAVSRRRAASTSPGGSSAGSTNVIVPDLSEIPRTGFGMGNLVFESRDYDWSDYGRQVYMAIWRAWHRRLWQTSDEFEKWAFQNSNWMLDHSSQVHFVIEDNGQVTGITLEAGSTCEPFDAAALEALAEVILPPLPPDFPRDREVVHARFIGRGPIKGMRPTFRRMRQLGYF